jgi:hypothetical protein
MQYLTASFQKSLNSFTWGLGSTVETILQTKIQLPTKNNKPDFAFMESFISQIENERISKLENYLEDTEQTLLSLHKELTELEKVVYSALPVLS